MNHAQTTQGSGWRDSPRLPDRIHPVRRSRPQRARAGRSVLERSRGFNHVLGIDAAFFHHFRAGRTQAELMQPDDFAVEADILIPNLGNAGFYRDAFTARFWKHFLAIFLRFAIETLEARHRDDAHAIAKLL